MKTHLYFGLLSCGARMLKCFEVAKAFLAPIHIYICVPDATGLDIIYTGPTAIIVLVPLSVACVFLIGHFAQVSDPVVISDAVYVIHLARRPEPVVNSPSDAMGGRSRVQYHYSLVAMGVCRTHLFSSPSSIPYGARIVLSVGLWKPFRPSLAPEQFACLRLVAQQLTKNLRGG